MSTSNRVLLIEHLDAIGAAAPDARQHAAALRAAGFEVEGLVLEDDRDADLLFPSRERPQGPGFDAIGREELAARVRASRATTVLWAGASPGGGGSARSLPSGLDARWWPTGHAPAGAAAGPLPAIDASFAPIAGSALAGEPARRRLSLWDGPFALLPAVPGARAAAPLIEAFADAMDRCDEVDLVVLAHPDAGFEQLARRAGIAQRVHFVGAAPREAEHAWLGTAVTTLVPGDAPFSGGLLLRALESGCTLLPVDEAAAPVAAWLESHALAWAGATLADRLVAALQRTEPVREARDRGRHVAVAHGQAALTARLGAALAAGAARGRRAA